MSVAFKRRVFEVSGSVLGLFSLFLRVAVDEVLKFKIIRIHDFSCLWIKTLCIVHQRKLWFSQDMCNDQHPVLMGTMSIILWILDKNSYTSFTSLF